MNYENEINILHLEDNKYDAELIKSALVKEGFIFKLINVESRAKYLEILKKNNIDIILADYSLPSFDGLEALKITKEIKPDIPFIFLSGVMGEEFAIESLKSGAIDYVLKNQLGRLGSSITRALNESSEKKRRKIVEEKLKLSYEKLTKTFDQIVEAFSSLSEKKDPYTAGHQRNVSLIATAISKELNLPKDQVQGVRIAAKLHDIGKIYVPSEILNKPGKLSEYEFNIIKTHPNVGYEILKEIEFPWPVAMIVLQHHERIDGSGYLQGLKGDEILLEARIISVADVIEAMVSHRPYRPSLGLESALKEILSKRGTSFDPDVVDACLKLFKERDFEIPDVRF